MEISATEDKIKLPSAGDKSILCCAEECGERLGVTLGPADRVAVLPGEALGADLEHRGVLSKGKLLIKRVAAVAGDRVCRQGASVSVNGEIAAKAMDVGSRSIPLPSWQGCFRLRADQVFLLGDTPGSYDGRYFGLTLKPEIFGQSVLMYAL